VLWVTDAREPLADVVALARTELGSETPCTIIQNKVDLLCEAPASFEYDAMPVVRLSALTGAGIDLLRTHLRRAAQLGGEADGTFSARRRHLEALARAAMHLTAAQAELQSSALELAAEQLRGAQMSLSELTGELTSDELLGEIFASFCIGK
jgi:tRNA modification GTPase